MKAKPKPGNQMQRVMKNIYKLADKRLEALVGITAFCILLLEAQPAMALPVNLGAAGPGNWAVLETAANAASANVSIANASSAGYINGNVGIAGKGNISDSGTPITGNVYVGSSASVNPNVAANVSGSVIQTAASQTLLTQAAADAASASAAASALSGTAIANITTGGTFAYAPGVYDLSQINLSGVTLTLNGTAGQYYVFNISDSLTLSSASIVLSGGLTADNVLFNITRVGGTGLGMSGGLATESELYGIVLADYSQVQETPGLVVGEIISGDNVSIASGAQVQGIPNIPDAGSSLLLMSFALGFLATAKKRFIS
jgi:Ice-binding-like